MTYCIDKIVDTADSSRLYGFNIHALLSAFSQEQSIQTFLFRVSLVVWGNLDSPLLSIYNYLITRDSFE